MSAEENSTDANPAEQPDSGMSPAKESFQQKTESLVDRQGEGSVKEKSLWAGGYSPRAMYGTWVISLLVTIAALVLVGIFARDQQLVWTITGIALLVWWCFVIGLFLYRRWSLHYELTTQRFIHQTGLLVRRTDRIEVIDIADVSFTQGIIQRFLGVGTIHISSSDRTHPELVMNGIDNVPEVASLIDDIRREERRRRMLHIESV